MVFSTPLFLFAFLPLMLFFYYAAPKAIRNYSLLFGSFLFYAWGEVFYVLVMVASIVLNYTCGRLMGSKPHAAKLFLTVGVAANLLLLVSFKYLNFMAANLNAVLSAVGGLQLEVGPVHLPLGISFFTFQAISYLVDVFRKEAPPQKSITNLALYISLFPQLIAGPIVRYHDVAGQIVGRNHRLGSIAEGTRRFVVGLAKKILIANPLGESADLVFSFSGEALSLPTAWIGIFFYTLQIYYDFSGYSDMAIGLGRMFGFRFFENFNYPYIATSLREFWRRWHISLSTWFKDYVYIPLGGSRVPYKRVYFNLFVVFFLTGFWHGASWNFIVWGLFHGIFLAMEHAGFCNVLNRWPRPFRHCYTLAVVVVAWVFFRAETLSYAMGYLYAMIDLSRFHAAPIVYAQLLPRETLFAFGAGAMLSAPVCSRFFEGGRNLLAHNSASVNLFGVIRNFAVLLMLMLSVSKMAASTYNPFIYFRF